LTAKRVERRLAAVLAADVAGYSRMMCTDEEGTLAGLKSFRKTLVDPTIAAHRGRIVKTTGDGMLVEFASAVDAARCAIRVQLGMAEQNATMPQVKRIEFRIGIHVGDIIVDDNDIFGDGVHIAARLEGIAEPGGVCISDDTYRQIRGKVEIVCDDLGSQSLKNIAEPMRVWRVQLGIRRAGTVRSGAEQATAAVRPALALPDKPSIAVLPFQNMSGDPEQEYFAHGVGSLDIARAFALCADVTGSDAFLRHKAWPVLSGVAEWIKSRVTKRRGKYEIRSSMGIAERKSPSNNAIFTNMSARIILRDTISAAKQLKRPIDPAWQKIATKMVVPKRGRVVISHDAFRVDEEKAATPDPLMGIFPLGFDFDHETEQATLAYYLKLAKRYIGSPMLSPLYGVWAARSGNRKLSLDLLDRGYGDFCTDRFMQTLEYRRDVFPEQPPAGPFFANLGGFLLGLILGFPKIQPGPETPQEWCKGKVVLPAGWRSIEIDHLWIRGRPWRLSAVHGEPGARLEPISGH